MAKVGGGSQQQQQKTDPWDGLKPYLIGLDGKTGIMPEAERLYKESAPKYFEGDTYAGMNDMQKGAISGMADYYNSPASMAGANAATSVGNSLLSPANNYMQPMQFGRSNTPGSPMATNMMVGTADRSANDRYPPATPAAAPMQSSSPMNIGAQQIATPNIPNAPGINVPQVQLGTSGVDWKTAMSDVLKGDVNNPYLSGIADTIGRKAADNYNTNLAPQIRGGAQMAGQFGGSRQGVVEANALKDLNQGVSDSVANLYGNAYNQAQQSKGQGALALSGQESGERTTNAQIAANAATAQAQMQNQMNMLRANLDYQTQKDNQQFQLGLGDLGLRSDLGMGDLNLRSNLGTGELNLKTGDQSLNRQLAGVGLLNQASQMPIQNMQGLFNLGGLQQKDQQGQIDADMQRWNYNQTMPWQNLQNYMGLVTGSGGRYGEGMSNSKGLNWGLDFTDSGGGGGGGGGGGMSSAAAAAMLLSDRRVKRNIVKIGSRPDGLNVYAYNYLWSDEPQIGVMADEVKQIKPHAVVTLDNGLMAVNYGAL